jgi:hypothetical protein
MTLPITLPPDESSLDSETLMSSAIANSVPNRNSLFEFLLVESKPEFR